MLVEVQKDGVPVANKKLFGKNQKASIKPEKNKFAGAELADGFLKENIKTVREAVSSKSLVDKLNEEFHKKFGYLEQELNRWCTKTSLEPNALGLVDNFKMDLTKPIGATVATQYDGAFSLNQPIGGQLVPFTIPRVGLENMLIFRHAIGYKDAIKWSKDGGDIFTPHVFMLLEYLKKMKGYGPETLTIGPCYATFLRPFASSNEYFREMADYAAFELRLYSNCTKVEIAR